MKGIAEYSIQDEDIVIYLWDFQSIFHVFSSILPVLGRHDVKWRPCISKFCSIDIMTQVCNESIYFGAQHILDLANNSFWAWHTKATMWAIWVNDKSWVHLVTLPFPNRGVFIRRPKGMLDT